MSPYAPMPAPSLDDFDQIARAVWAGLPGPFKAIAGDLVFRIEDFADEQVLAELDLEDPFELTGLYVGVDLTRQSVGDGGGMPPMVFLFRRPILDEWADNGEATLEELIAHVLVHEVGHHFGLSDEDIDALLERA